jgi:nicotinamide-nucleotide amidase
MLDATLDVAIEQLRAAGHELARPAHAVELVLCGIGESDAAVRVTALPEVDGLDLAWLPHPGQVRLIISGEASRVCAACDAIRPVLRESIVSEDGRSLPEVIVAALASREESVGAAESCTGGLVSAALTSVAGSSAVVRAGIVAYANEAKVELLGVPAALLAEKGAVSEEVAMAMASGMRKAAGADWGLGVTGIAGPSGGSVEKPVGLVFIAVAAPDGRRAARRLQLHGSRDDIRSASTSALLDLLRRSL